MNHPNKPFAESCAENQQPILEVIEPLFRDCIEILEIGSGTGQHAVHFATALPHLRWQTSELPENHPGIQAWLDDEGLDNVLPPIDLDVSGEWPERLFDGVFSANTAHIMHWPQVRSLFQGAGKVLKAGGLFVLYGPFNYGGRFSSDSNRRFDLWLKERDPHTGIRDADALHTLAEACDLQPEDDIEMPVNNRILVWRKTLG